MIDLYNNDNRVWFFALSVFVFCILCFVPVMSGVSNIDWVVYIGVCIILCFVRVFIHYCVLCLYFVVVVVVVVVVVCVCVCDCRCCFLLLLAAVAIPIDSSSSATGSGVVDDAFVVVFYVVNVFDVAVCVWLPLLFLLLLRFDVVAAVGKLMLF